MRRALLLFSVLLAVTPLFSQRVGVGYYDLDALYDTIPSPFYNDSAFTPTGANRWSSQRYLQKIKKISAVIDSMSLPIIGLYGVESEAVVCDIVEHCNVPYSYLHRDNNSFDGQDFALLYYGDILTVEAVESGRNLLLIEGNLGDNIPATIILSDDGGDLISYLKSNPLDSNSMVIAMGALRSSHIKKLKLRDLSKEKINQGAGNYYSSNGWVMRDRVAVSPSLEVHSCGSFAAPWLLSAQTHAPLPTFENHKYLGGFSKYLPIFVYLF